MPTTLTVIDSSASGFPGAGRYYRMCSSEKLANGGTIPIQRDKIQEIGRLTLDVLLDTIIDAGLSSNDNVILVVHAREGGISLRLLSGSETRARADVLNLLSGSRSSGDIAPIVRLSVPQIDSLRNKMRRVQELGLARLEIRGCNIGAYESTLRATKAFFLVTCIGGPRVRNAYSSFNFNRNSPQRNFDRISEDRNGRLDEIPGGLVGFQITPRGEHHFVVRNCCATTSAVFESWVRRFFPVTGAVPGAVIYLHGQFVNNRLILPADSDYVRNLREYCGSATLSLEGL